MKKEESGREIDYVEQLYIPSGKAVCLVFAVACAVFMPINLSVGNHRMAVINGVISLCMLIAWLSILKSKTLKIAVPLIMAVLIFVTVQYLITGGEEGFSVLWVLLIPPFAIYILDLKKAVGVSLFIWLLVMIGLWSPLNAYCYDYSRTFEIRFPLLYAVEIVIAILIKKKIFEVERKRDELLTLNIQYKNDAEKANRAKSDFLASMSHEIRTPINAVLGMNEMILRESTEETILEYASNVDSSGKFLLSLINDILDISKIESGKMELICAEYSLRALLADVLRMAYSRAEEKEIKILTEISPDVPERLYGDGMKIRQVITNLMTNAIKYTNAGGTAVLIVSGTPVDAAHIRLQMGVKDNGKGIRREDIGMLFDAFQRVDETSNTAIEGTGLGLAISQSYMKMMDGELQVESEYGKGSYFYFTVPQKICGDETIGGFEQEFHVGSNAGLAERMFHKQKFTAPAARILVVDDNEMNRVVMKGLLKRTRMQADFADSGADCLAQAADNDYDIILLDHMMPEMDGIETLAELKRRYPKYSAKIIALTANAISGAKQMYLESGFDDYMTKPVDGDMLENMLAKYIPPEKIERTSRAEQEAAFAGQEAPAKTKEPAGQEAAPASAGAGDAVSFTELKAWKETFPELDVLLGLEYSIGSREFYLELLRMFAEQNKLASLNQYYEEEDWERYHNLVHALKSTALSVGLVRLSEEARQLEYAAARKDYAYIWQAHKETMEFYAECVGKIRDCVLQ